MWVRCCWWALGLLVVLFLAGYALFIHILLTADNLVLDQDLVRSLLIASQAKARYFESLCRK